MPPGQGRTTALTLTLTHKERRLLSLAQHGEGPTCTPQFRRRARLILLVAQGQGITAIAREVGLTRKMIYKWVTRWEHEGLRGLRDQKKGYPPGRYGPGVDA